MAQLDETERRALSALYYSAIDGAPDASARQLALLRQAVATCRSREGQALCKIYGEALKRGHAEIALESLSIALRPTARPKHSLPRDRVNYSR